MEERDNGHQSPFIEHLLCACPCAIHSTPAISNPCHSLVSKYDLYVSDMETEGTQRKLRNFSKFYLVSTNKTQLCDSRVFTVSTRAHLAI